MVKNEKLAGGRDREDSWGTGSGTCSGTCSHAGSAGRGKLLREETHGKESRQGPGLEVASVPS